MSAVRPTDSARNTPSRLGARSFICFALVGGTATALHYLIMAALIASGACEAGWASATGYSLSTAFNYTANARLTFGGGHDHRQALPRFLITAAAGLGINQLVLLGLHALGLPVIAAQLAATGCVLIWNYVINATWSFAHKEDCSARRQT